MTFFPELDFGRDHAPYLWLTRRLARMLRTTSVNGDRGERFEGGGFDITEVAQDGHEDVDKLAIAVARPVS